MQRSSTTTISSANPRHDRQSASWRFLVMGDDAAAESRHRSLTPPRSRPGPQPARRRLGGLDRQAVHQGVGGAVVEARAEHRLWRVRRRDEGGARTPGRILAARARAEQAQGRRAAGGGDVHQPGVVADEQGAAPQHRRRGQQIDPADQVDRRSAGIASSSGWPARARGRRPAPRRALPAADRLGPVSRGASSAKRSAAPLLAAPVRRRADRQHRAAGRKQCRGRRDRGAARSTAAGRAADRGRRGAELAHAMLASIALGHHPAFAGAQQPGKRRAAQIDDDIPAPGRDRAVERQPMQRPAPLFDDRAAVRIRAPLRTTAPPPARRRSSAARRDSARSGGRETGRQHGVADARRGDKQDVHLARSSSPHIPRPGLPSRRASPTSSPPQPFWRAMADASICAARRPRHPRRRRTRPPRFSAGPRLQRCRQGRPAIRRVTRRC